MSIKLDGTVDFIASNIWEVTRNPGIYLLHDLRGVLYVGKSVNIRRRYEEHISRENNIELIQVYRNPIGPIKFSWVATNNLDETERELVRLFKPRCNRIKYSTA